MWVMGGALGTRVNLSLPQHGCAGSRSGFIPWTPTALLNLPLQQKKDQKSNGLWLSTTGGRISVEDPRPYISQQSADPPGVGEL